MQLRLTVIRASGRDTAESVFDSTCDGDDYREALAAFADALADSTPRGVVGYRLGRAAIEHGTRRKIISYRAAHAGWVADYPQLTPVVWARQFGDDDGLHVIGTVTAR